MSMNVGIGANHPMVDSCDLNSTSGSDKAGRSAYPGSATTAANAGSGYGLRPANKPPLDFSSWANHYAPEWNPNQVYKPGDQVRHSGVIYRAPSGSGAFSGVKPGSADAKWLYTGKLLSAYNYYASHSSNSSTYPTPGQPGSTVSKYPASGQPDSTGQTGQQTPLGNQKPVGSQKPQEPDKQPVPQPDKSNPVQPAKIGLKDKIKTVLISVIAGKIGGAIVDAKLHALKGLMEKLFAKGGYERSDIDQDFDAAANELLADDQPHDRQDRTDLGAEKPSDYINRGKGDHIYDVKSGAWHFMPSAQLADHFRKTDGA